MKKEYDFSKGVRGKYAARYAGKAVKPKKFDWLEFDEAVVYFVRRFSGKDVTISTAGTLIRVMPWVGKIEYSVLRDKSGWTVWGLTSEGDEPLRLFRSYERAAIFLERRISKEA